MCVIMSELQRYCPFLSFPRVVGLPSGDTLPSKDVKCHEILFGGDQLTRARAVSAIRIRAGHDEVKDQLTGLVPVIEDWHARQTLLKVCIFTSVIYTRNHNNIICVGYLA